MSDHTPDILTICRTIVPTYDGRVPSPGKPGAPTGAHAIVYGGTATPSRRCLSGQATARDHAWSIVCVSNTPTGCRTITGLLTAALDAHVIGLDLLTVELVSDPLEDRDDPAEWRWTSTIDLRLTTTA